MKKCSYCGNEVNDTSAFCDRCGRPVESEPAAAEYAYRRPENYQQPVNYSQPVGYQQPVKQKKKTPVWLIIIIVISGLFLVGAIAGIMSDDGETFSGAEVNTTESQEKDSEAETTTPKEPEKDEEPVEDEEKPFSRGYTSDGVYINEWANIKFTFPEDWDETEFVELDESLGYSELQIFNAATSENMSVLLEKVNKTINEKLYLVAVKSRLPAQFEEMGMVPVFGETREETVGGQKFTVMDITFEEETGFVQRFMIRKQGDYMIVITISVLSFESADEVAEGFDKVN